MIFIKDNFFTKEELLQFRNIQSNCFYNLCKNKRQLQSSDLFYLNIDAKKKLIEKIQKVFFKINKFKEVTCDFRKRKTPPSNKNREDKYIHRDESYWNCLIYLTGPASLYDGTTFYKKIKDTFTIQDMIGFKENRAILFRGRTYHGTSQVYTENDNWRETINVFFLR
jgi:hypothetical protein